MRKMILFAILALLLIPAGHSYGQTFGVQAGMNFPSAMVKDDDETYSDNNKIKPAFHIGGVVNFEIMEALSVEGSLLLALKGGRVVEKDGDYKYTENANIFYFDMPVTAKYTFDLGSVKLYGAAGPYFGFGITGKYKWKEEWDGQEDSDNEKVEWGPDEEEDDLIRPDAGMIIGTGAIFGNIQAGLFYELGLINISPYRDNGFRIKNRNFGITAKYFFGK